MGELEKKKKHYPTSVMWWNRLIKRRIKLQFITEGQSDGGTDNRWSLSITKQYIAY
jgi:hypothetical protein